MAFRAPEGLWPWAVIRHHSICNIWSIGDYCPQKWVGATNSQFYSSIQYLHSIGVHFSCHRERSITGNISHYHIPCSNFFPECSRVGRQGASYSRGSSKCGWEMQPSLICIWRAQPAHPSNLTVCYCWLCYLLVVHHVLKWKFTVSTVNSGIMGISLVYDWCVPLPWRKAGSQVQPGLQSFWRTNLCSHILQNMYDLNRAPAIVWLSPGDWTISHIILQSCPIGNTETAPS